MYNALSFQRASKTPRTHDAHALDDTETTAYVRHDPRAATVVVPFLLLVPSTAAAASRLKIVVDSTEGQPNAGEPELWTWTVYSDGRRIRAVPECRTVSCDHVQITVQLP